MKKTFTLIELIVVISILAILSITSFVLLTKWIVKARNSRRIADVQLIKRALERYYYARKSLNTDGYQYPLPGDAVEITSTTGELLGYV